MLFPEYFIFAAILVSFYASFMGGANDFANAFGTSVGSGAITMRHAVIIAIFAEFAGAVLVGSSVTDTVRKGIIDPFDFADDPRVLAVGLAAALLGSAIFLQGATHFGLPVSTTHAIVGSVAGFGIVAVGFDCVKWNNMASISASWVISPVVGATAAYVTFMIIQSSVLNKHNPVEAASKAIPWFVGSITLLVVFSILFKGLPNLHLDFDITGALLWAIGLAVVVSIVVKTRLLKSSKEERPWQIERVERTFKILQVSTAAYVAFAHGSNDVANGIGPLAGIWAINTSGAVGMKSPVPLWILILGATGIVLGLGVYGRKVIETVGRKITSITPSRGFSAEFSTATVVLCFSKLGMPISTTHTLVGAVIGVGLARGIGAIDLRVVKNIFTAWFITVPSAALVSAGLFVLLRYLILSN